MVRPSVRPSLSDSSSAAAESQNVAKRRRLGQARLFHFVMKTVARRRRRKGGNGSKKCTGRRRRRRRLSKNIKTKHPKQQKVGKRKEGGNTHPIFHPFHSFWPLILLLLLLLPFFLDPAVLVLLLLLQLYGRHIFVKWNSLSGKWNIREGQGRKEGTKERASERRISLLYAFVI